MLTPEEIRTYRKLFTALSDPTRLAIMSLLLNEPGLAVNDIKSRFTVSRTSISRHLQILQRVGLVDGRRVSSHVYYSVDDGSMTPNLLIRFGALLRDVDCEHDGWDGRIHAFCPDCGIPREEVYRQATASAESDLDAEPELGWTDQ